AAVRVHRKRPRPPERNLHECTLSAPRHASEGAIIGANDLSPEASPKLLLALRERSVLRPVDLDSLVEEIRAAQNAAQRWARQRTSQHGQGGGDLVQF